MIGLVGKPEMRKIRNENLSCRKKIETSGLFCVFQICWNSESIHFGGLSQKPKTFWSRFSVIFRGPMMYLFKK